MDKKIVSRIANKNLCFIIITIFGILSFLQQLSYALGGLQQGGVLNNVEYSILQLKFIITMQGGLKVEYTVGYYPLVGIVAGIIYNSYAIIKNFTSERKKNLQS